MLSQLLSMIEQLLEKSLKEPTAVLKDEAIALHLTLGKYNEYSASLLHKDPKSLDIFIKAVHTTKELCTGMPAIQITALEKVSDFFQRLKHVKLLNICNVYFEKIKWSEHVSKEYDIFDPFLQNWIMYMSYLN